MCSREKNLERILFMKTKKILFGTAYYTEYIPYDRIDDDFALMKKAGMNVIRIGESTWGTLAPKEGSFDFKHLDKMLDAALRYQIQVIVGTPTCAVPSWLIKKAPDILTAPTDTNSGSKSHQQIDITNSTYLRYAEHMIRGLASHIKDHPCIIGYQLDDETKPFGASGTQVKKRFLEHLRLTFNNDLESMNQTFGLNYRSNRIHRWNDILEVPYMTNDSLSAEFARFQRSLVTEFLRWQASILNQYKYPHQFITHNFDFSWKDASFGLQPQVDQYETSQIMDVAGCNIYHPSQDALTGAEITFCGNVARGMKKDNYLVLETQAQGQPAWLPYPEQLRLQAFSHLSNGANSLLYWHWHSTYNASESYFKGVLSHDFTENPTYQEAVTIGMDLERLSSHLVNLKKENRVAVVVSYASLTGMEHFPLPGIAKDSYNVILRWICDSLYRLNVEYDIIWDQDVSSLHAYELVCIPALYSATEQTLAAINDYVFSGGHILATFKTGFSDAFLKIRSELQPYHLTDCFGMHYNQFTVPSQVSLSSAFAYPLNDTPVLNWMELLIPDTAETLCSYQHPAWGSYAAVTHNHYGNGTASYLGCYFSPQALDALLTQLLPTLGISLPMLRYPIIRHTGINELGKPITYYLNFSNTPKQFTYTEDAGVLLLEDTTIQPQDRITLPAWGTVIVEQSETTEAEKEIVS